MTAARCWLLAIQTGAVRLPRDYYVRAFSNDYSVDPAMIGRAVDVAASLERVTVHHDGVLIAEHRRKWARQLTVTDPAHVLRAAELGAQARDAGWSHEEYLAAVLSKEVSEREASGAALRIKAAGSPVIRPSRTSTSTTSPPQTGT